MMTSYLRWRGNLLVNVLLDLESQLEGIRKTKSRKEGHLRSLKFDPEGHVMATSNILRTASDGDNLDMSMLPMAKYIVNKSCHSVRQLNGSPTQYSCLLLCEI